MAWQERNDNVPGWVYLLEAEGYHGLVPGAMVALLGIGLLIGSSIRESTTPQLQQRIEESN